MSTQATPASSQDLIAAYKAILRDVLDKRPSGMRQRLAEALGKNRSFITQIANPAYQTPIPAQHVHPIIQVCHFSVQERDRFLDAYHRAHPRRLLLLKERERNRRLTLMLPDLGSEQKNHKRCGEGGLSGGAPNAVRLAAGAENLGPETEINAGIGKDSPGERRGGGEDHGASNDKDDR